MSATQDFLYTMDIKVLIKGTVTKKNTVRDAIVAQLNTAKTAGNIESADWTLTGEVAPEGGKI
jgi:hypothetical protein